MLKMPPQYIDIKNINKKAHTHNLHIVSETCNCFSKKVVSYTLRWTSQYRLNNNQNVIGFPHVSLSC